MKFTPEQARAEIARRKGLEAQQSNAQQKPETSFGRYLGIGARGALQGIGAIPDFLALPANIGLMYSGQQPLPSISENIGQGFDYLTNNAYAPETFGEKALGTGLEFVAGGAGIAKAGSTAGSKLAQKYLAPQGAAQYASLAGAGAGLEAGKELAPDSAVVPFLGALAGGFTPNIATSLAKTAIAPRQAGAEALSNFAKINPEKYQAFMDAGLKPTLADISDSRFTKGAQNMLLEVPFADAPITQSIKQTQDQIAKIGEGLPQISAGELAQSGLKDWQIRGSEIAGKLQQRMREFVAPSEAIPVASTIKVIQNRPKFTTKEAATQFAMSPVGKEYQKLANIAARSEGTVPYEDLVYFRQQIDDQINNFGMLGFDKEQGALKQLRTSIQKDIGESFRAKGNDAYKAFERHNKFYSDFAKKNENIVNDLIKNKTATETFKSIVSDLRVDAKKADTVLKTLSPDQKQVFSKSLIRELGMNPQNEFTPAYLATNFKKLEPQAQEVVLSSFNAEGKRQFKATIEAIDAMKGTKAIANPSGTFNQGLRLGIVGSALNAPIQTGVGLLAGKATANLMTNEGFIKWMGEASKITNAKKAMEHTGKLAQMAKTMPQLAPDIQQYLKSLETTRQQPQDNTFVDETVVETPDETFIEESIQREFTPEEVMQEIERRKSLQQSSAPQQNNIEEIIKSSANNTGLNPEFVKKVAIVESNLNPNAQAKGSTASGLFQFTNGTWRDMVKKYGRETGITIKDKNNPVANTQMASLYLRDNATKLMRVLNREPSQGEVYASHFLGLGGANKLIKNYGSGKIAAMVFPKEARANPSIFYKKGRPLSVEELYSVFENKMIA